MSPPAQGALLSREGTVGEEGVIVGLSYLSILLGLPAPCPATGHTMHTSDLDLWLYSTPFWMYEYEHFCSFKLQN